MQLYVAFYHNDENFFTVWEFGVPVTSININMTIVSSTSPAPAFS